MPAVRFSRDKRGYEYVYLVHTPIRRGKPGRSRVLYWYRTPPGVRVGRKPFDLEVQRSLERQNPGVVFDWEAIVGTPMPPPDMTEFWRERRRAEKIARQERKAMEAEEAGEAEGVEAGEPEAAQEAGQVNVADAPDEAPDLEETPPATPVAPPAEERPVPAPAGAAVSAGSSPDAQSRKRRRRRGGRRRPGPGQEQGQADSRGEDAVDSAPDGE